LALNLICVLRRYPHLFFPEMYLMKGGYKEFYTGKDGIYQVVDSLCLFRH
jgi:hypothetical protein